LPGLLCKEKVRYGIESAIASSVSGWVGCRLLCLRSLPLPPAQTCDLRLGRAACSELMD